MMSSSNMRQSTFSKSAVDIHSNDPSKSRNKRKLVVGVCALDVKARSKPMCNILSRLLLPVDSSADGDFETLIFGDRVILEEPIEHWPPCDFLISFYSRGFPLQKAIQYVKLQRPFCVNDLAMQQLLLDRRMIMLILEAIDVPTARRLCANRDDGPVLPEELRDIVSRDFNIDFSGNLFPREEISQSEDGETLIIGNRTIRKPFVEKPANADDHNIHIYQTRGVRRLFRKVANKSSDFVEQATKIRTDSSYMYEAFLDPDNSEDIKVYTIGPYFSYAETRKSPIVDGIVRRNAEGKEIRQVTMLSDEEQELARRVCMAFGQTICGFDLLRCNGKSYVIDVNGWSFVKGNDFYYDKCAKILRDTFLRVAFRKRKASLSESSNLAYENQWRLKAWIAVFRHGDRTPKQKLKLILKDKPFWELVKDRKSERALRSQADLGELLTTAKGVLVGKQPDSEDTIKLAQLVETLTKTMRLPGTKAQLRPLPENDSLLVIVKWGGEFTHAGRHHSKDLGENLRKDLQILNKAVLDDIKIFSSIERRVQATAEVFAKAFLPLAELPEGLVCVKKDILDNNVVQKNDIDLVRTHIRKLLNTRDVYAVDTKSMAIGEESCLDSSSLYPRVFSPQLPEHPRALVDELLRHLAYRRTIMRENFANHALDCLRTRWCCSESSMLFRERWEKLFEDLLDVDRSKFDPSRISDLYDSLKFDALHHKVFFERVFVRDPNDPKEMDDLRAWLTAAQQLFNFVSPQEYGVTVDEKLRIGLQISGNLLKEIIDDLANARTLPLPFTRLYFTKESHVQSLMNVLAHGGLDLTPLTPSASIVEQPESRLHELDYLTHICFEVYQRYKLEKDDSADKSRENRKVQWSLRIGVSPGAHDPHLLDLQLDARHALQVAPRRWITGYMEAIAATDTLRNLIDDSQNGLFTRDSLEELEQSLLLSTMRSA